MGSAPNYKPKHIHGSSGHVLEDVPQFSNYTPHLLTYSDPLEEDLAYSVVKQYLVNMDDIVWEKILAPKDSPRGVHFRRGGP